MFDEIVLETETGRVGGLASSSGSKLDVVFQAGEPPEQKTRGKSYQAIKFPSLTFLRRVAPEYLKELWGSEPEYVLHLALEQLPPEKRSSRECGKLIRQGSEAFDADSKKLAPLFKKLEKRGAIKLLGTKPEKIYELVEAAEPKVPVEHSWLCGTSDAAGGPKKIAISKDPAPDANSEGELAVTRIPKDLEADRSEVAHPPTLKEYLAALADDNKDKPANFEDWVSQPFDRAVEILTEPPTGEKLALRKARISGYSLVALLPSDFWNSSKESAATLNRIKTAALLKTISANWEKDWMLLPHFGEIASVDSGLTQGTAPIELLRVLAALGRAGAQDSPLANHVLGHLLKEAKTDKAINSEKQKSGSEQVREIISAATLCFSPGRNRTNLIIRAITKWGEVPNREQLGDYSLTELLNFLEEYELSLGGRIQARKSASYTSMMQVVSELVSHAIRRVGDEAALVAAIRLQSGYVLEIDPDLMAKFIASSFGNMDRLRPVSKSLSGLSQLKLIEQERDHLKIQVETQSEKLKHLGEDLNRVSVELAELRKRSLSDRRDQVQSDRASNQELATPALRILARSLSAAYEFLSENPGAIGRFEILADQAQLARIGNSGEELIYNPLLHTDPENEAQPGDVVKIHNVGFKLEDGDSEKVLLKATVVRK